MLLGQLLKKSIPHPEQLLRITPRSPEALMKIVVCIKQVPKSDTVKFDKKTGSLLREGVKSILNPYDFNAIEAAINIREKFGGEVYAITMGPPQAAEVIKEAMTMGVDSGVVLSDRAFAGSDTLATTYTLAKGIKKLCSPDVVICGKESIDGETGQVGPGLAVRLDMPSITCAEDIKFNGESFVIKKLYEWGYDIVETKPPVLITTLSSLNRPRLPSLKCMIKVKDTKIPLWNADDIGADPAKLGLSGSPTKVFKTFVPDFNAKQEMIQGNPEEQAEGLVNRLIKTGILNNG